MLYPLVVVYNKSCADSPTCRALLNQSRKPQSVLIFDNSTRDFGNRAFCEKQGWQYLGGQGNQGLSKPYNQAADVLRGREGFLCLLDDDTDLPETFFEHMQAQMEGHPQGQIFVPVLMQNGQIISPNRADLPGRQRFFSSVEECLQESQENLRAFNSCMCIQLKIFDSYRYDERLFLDCVDHAFLRDMRQRRIPVTVLPVVCQHGFSGKQKGSFEAAQARFRIWCKDTYVYYEKNPGKCLATVGKRAVHLCGMYKSLAFLKIWMEAGKIKQ